MSSSLKTPKVLATMRFLGNLDLFFLFLRSLNLEIGFALESSQTQSAFLIFLQNNYAQFRVVEKKKCKYGEDNGANYSLSHRFHSDEDSGSDAEWYNDEYGIDYK